MFGVLAEFETAASVYHACEKVRDAGYTKWDAHTPFSVHGLDKAMGLKASPLPWIVLVMGLTGAVFGYGLQVWVHSIRYPLIISGKPFYAWPAYIPVAFELTVLFACLGAVLGLFGLAKLPQLYHSLFRSPRFKAATDDKFFISIEAGDPVFDTQATQAMLRQLGATHVELVEE
jgi:hypothetical protein